MNQKKERFSEFVGQVLTNAGWFPGRNMEELVEKWEKALDRSGGFLMFSAARAALREFGGLDIHQRGAGITCGRYSVHIDPMHGLYEEERFEEFANLLGSHLYPLGEIDGGHVFFAIDESGRCFMIMEEAWFLGENIDEALEHLIAGIKSPLVQPDGS